MSTPWSSRACTPVGQLAKCARAYQLLEQFGLKLGAEHRPGQISGGQAQRVAICRALLNNPTSCWLTNPPGTSTRATPSWSWMRWPKRLTTTATPCSSPPTTRSCWTGSTRWSSCENRRPDPRGPRGSLDGEDPQRTG
ncbi:MAG: ATP-binding cassette domain-containing protein, partial [Propionibacteriaceae bacterium]